MTKTQWTLIFTFIVLGAVVQADEQAGLTATLDTFHQAAAGADMTGYFQAMTDDVVFLGTDGSERWQGQEFRDFVASHFSEGRGWEYRPVERHVMLAADGQTAWFDETLQNNDLGLCRGSGVLVKSTGEWKIAQYNLSVPVPNAMVLDVVADIAALDTQATAATAESAGDTAAAPAIVTEPDTCRKKRFKTNRKAGC